MSDSLKTVLLQFQKRCWGLTESGEGAGQRVYIGQVYDGDTTGLSYLNARYYSGTNAKFLSQDPVLVGSPANSFLTDPQTLNYYSYSTNNPINRSDPSGLFSITNGVVNNMVVKGDTADSIAGILNNAYAAQYGVYFSKARLIEFNGGEPKVGSYYSFSIDLGDKFAMNGSGYSGGGGAYVGGETNSSAGSVGGGSTPNYIWNTANTRTIANPRQDITNSLMGAMRASANESMCLNFSACFIYSFASSDRWNIKETPGGPYNSSTHKSGFIFMGKWIPSDAPGNINYGYVGSASLLTNPAILHFGAGAYQTLVHSRDQSVGFLQDNPGDPEYIDQGIGLYNADQK